MVNKELTEKAKEDLKIIELALTKGDPRAYNTLMSKYRDPIFFMLYERVNDRELAKELTIEAFGKAFNKLDSYTLILRLAHGCLALPKITALII